jgi:predicted nucleic acid-binding protein
VAFVVVYDACVLYPNTLRDLLIRTAQSGMVQAKWTDEILDEAFRSIARTRPDIATEKLERTRSLMTEAIRDAQVSGYEPIITALELPDPKDRHVLAAAIRCRAQVIVTDNTRHFPADYLASWDLEAKTADDFVMDQISLSRQEVYANVVRIADSRTSPAESVSDVLDQLRTNGLVESVAALASEA